MCWIPTSAVHRFRWVNSCFEATIVTSSEHLNESTISVVCHLFIAKVSPEWRLSPGFGTQTKCPFPLNRGVFPGQNFVPWMEEVSQRRGSIVIGCGMEEFSLSKIRRQPALFDPFGPQIYKLASPFCSILEKWSFFVECKVKENFCK